MDTTTALLCLLGMVALTSARPHHGAVHQHLNCGLHCKRTEHPRFQAFSPVLELQNRSIAPWTIENKTVFGTQTFLEAKCKPCILTDLKSEAIRVQIYLPGPVRNTTDGSREYCLCSYKLAVGCTCVPKHSQ